MQPEEIVGRKIDSGGDALLAEGAEELGGDVLAVGRLHDVERHGAGVPHAEAVVMLGGEDHVAEAGETGEAGKAVGVEAGGIEGLGEIAVEAFNILGAGAYEGVTDDGAELRVDAPVNEQAEALIAEPLQPLRAIPCLDVHGGFGPGRGRLRGGCKSERQTRGKETQAREHAFECTWKFCASG